MNGIVEGEPQRARRYKTPVVDIPLDAALTRIAELEAHTEALIAALRDFPNRVPWPSLGGSAEVAATEIRLRAEIEALLPPEPQR